MISAQRQEILRLLERLSEMGLPRQAVSPMPKTRP